MDSFEKITLDLPDIDEQHRITAIIDNAFSGIDLIELRRREVESLQADVLHSYLRDLPRRPLGDALSISTERVSVSPAESYNICGVYSFGRGLIRRPAIYGEETSYNSLTPIRFGMVVMSKLNAWEGALAVVPKDFTGYYVSPEYPTFEIDKSVAEHGFINHLVKWPELWEQLKPRGSMVRRKRTHPRRLLEIEVPFPDLDEQRRIAGVLDCLQEADKLAVHQETVLGALRRSVLNAAFSGQL